MIFPFTDMVNFVVAYAVAIANRRVPAAHKRLMLFAGILIIDAAASRLVFSLGGTIPMLLGVHLMLLASVLIYDFRRLKRPHWATLLGIGLFSAALLTKMFVAPTAGWTTFADRVFG